MATPLRVLSGCREARARLLSAANPTNRWTGATGSDFRIVIGPAKLVGNAVARSTQTLGRSLFQSEMSFEPVHIVEDYYDGPRTGVADFYGVRHTFRSLAWARTDDWDADDDRFELTREDGAGDTVIARGNFRVRQPVPDLPPGELRPLEVEWTPAER